MAKCRINITNRKLLYDFKTVEQAVKNIKDDNDQTKEDKAVVNKFFSEMRKSHYFDPILFGKFKDALQRLKNKVSEKDQFNAAIGNINNFGARYACISETAAEATFANSDGEQLQPSWQKNQNAIDFGKGLGDGGVGGDVKKGGGSPFKMMIDFVNGKANYQANNDGARISFKGFENNPPTVAQLTAMLQIASNDGYKVVIIGKDHPYRERLKDACAAVVGGVTLKVGDETINYKGKAAAPDQKADEAIVKGDEPIQNIHN